MKFDNNNIVQFYNNDTTAPYYAIYPLKNDAGGSVFSPVSREELYQWLDHDEGRRLKAYPRKSRTQRAVYEDRYDATTQVCNILDARTAEVLAIVDIINPHTMEYHIRYINAESIQNVLHHIRRMHYFWY